MLIRYYSFLELVILARPTKAWNQWQVFLISWFIPIAIALSLLPIIGSIGSIIDSFLRSIIGFILSFLESFLAILGSLPFSSPSQKLTAPLISS